MAQRVPQSRRRIADNYRLNASQIPLLRAVGFGILRAFLLIYDLLIAPTFTLSGYLGFVGMSGVYCLISWQILRHGYFRLRHFDVGLIFLLVDLPFILSVIHWTGANQSVLFFLLVLRVSDQTT